MTSEHHPRENQAYEVYIARFEGGVADGQEMELVGWPPLSDYMMPTEGGSGEGASAQRYVKTTVEAGSGKPVVHYRPG